MKAYLDIEEAAFDGYLLTIKEPGQHVQAVLGSCSRSEIIEEAEKIIRRRKSSIQVSAKLQEEIDCY